MIKKFTLHFPDKGEFREAYVILIEEQRHLVDIYNNIERYVDGTWKHDHQLGRIVINNNHFPELLDILTRHLPENLTENEYYWMSAKGELHRIRDSTEVQRIVGLHKNGMLPSDVVFKKHTNE